MTIPSFATLTATFGRIGLISFGGPAGQIALMHRELVDERQWIDEAAFLRALNICHLLPGPEAQQLATWIGWRLHGTWGGVVAGGLFVIPGALVMLALTMLYGVASGFGWFAGLFLGVKAAVLAIVVQALIRIAGRALKTVMARALAVMAFVGLFVFALPFPAVVLGAGVLGFTIAAYRPQWLALHEMPAATGGRGGSWRSTLAHIVAWGALWAAPMALIAATLGPDHRLFSIGAFFSQLAVVTFGGAYAVLAYMAQEAVSTHGWLAAGEMVDGLGLAETTPGPLILVTQFVGYLAASRAPAPFDPLSAGLIGAALTTWVTFIPCFLWIFALAPWIDGLARATRLQGALAAITAAVTGVIANLTLWFALHVLFGRLGTLAAGPVAMPWPEAASFDWRAGLLAAAALLLGLMFKWPVLRLLAVSAAAGWALGLMR